MKRTKLVNLDTLRERERERERESYTLVKRDIILKNIKFQKIVIKA